MCPLCPDLDSPVSGCVVHRAPPLAACRRFKLTVQLLIHPAVHLCVESSGSKLPAGTPHTNVNFPRLLNVVVWIAPIAVAGQVKNRSPQVIFTAVLRQQGSMYQTTMSDHPIFSLTQH
ncbi:hypothetical protein UPYG_G00286740 [Umbra pygmaea]|uniref:Uncharacterized protein n=1 Tax=Umbra pygmaea TaxID=75934 RepID=A0ABD0WTC4_UMBPY